MNSLVASFIRTYVPIIVTTIAAWLLSKGIVVDEQATAGLVAGLSGIIGGAYYALVRFLERRFPQLGWLLGAAKQPVYVEGEKVESAEKKVGNK